MFCGFPNQQLHRAPVRSQGVISQIRPKPHSMIPYTSIFLIRFTLSEKQFSRKYRLKNLGYNFEKALERVSTLLQLEKEYITGKGRQRDRVIARDLLCYWSVVELGMAMVDLARRFDITPAAVSFAVQRGEKMAKEKDRCRAYMKFEWDPKKEKINIREHGITFEQASYVFADPFALNKYDNDIRKAKTDGYCRENH